MILNPYLYKDLDRLTQQKPDVICFDKIVDGINNFVDKTQVRADKLLTPKESEEIKEEQDSLPPLDWLSSTMSGNTDVMLNNLWRQRRAWAALNATVINQWWNPGKKPDPDKT